MRGYLPVTPIEIQEFAASGICLAPYAYVMTSNVQRENADEDHEEIEFQLSYLAALDSRRRGMSVAGFALAIDLEIAQLGIEGDETIELVGKIRWNQVESVLVAESEDEELTWFASQEVRTQLPFWLEVRTSDGSV